ncbi:hypothetical protein MFLO_10718 [Listeria floridensis FSL S10-1187]|uniref:Uncharacterized protein n=1 Tax=Listeria floridensis FSL S10-1187 TaxID=1265817 RepID=A0ABN0RDT3_9LIST|nr:hypothetical protein MFLO_10718 [Listeria floridensis FSL S10-1187]
MGFYVVAYLLLFTFDSKGDISLQTQLLSWIYNYIFPGVIGLAILILTEYCCKSIFHTFKVKRKILYPFNIGLNMLVGYLLGAYSVFKVF